MKLRVLLLIAFSVISLAAEPASIIAPERILENYCAASKHQDVVARNASMEVDIDASLPKLRKQGRLHALRRISALGRITYEALKFEGDGTIKNQVIAKYLTAEAEAQKDMSPDLAVTPVNYKFKYKGLSRLDGRDVHMFEVSPKKKRVGLYRGELAIDSTTYLRVQESGCLVKNPSFLLKRVAFVRKYAIQDGIAVPVQVQSVVQTRLVGKAELTINYSNFAIESSASAGTEGQ